MRAHARTILAACALAASSRAAQAGRLHALPLTPKPRAAFVSALQDAARGPEILPNGAGVQLEGRTGILRTLELDDTTSLHLRLRIPF